MATLAGVGTYLLYTAVALDWRGFGGGRVLARAAALRSHLPPADLAASGSVLFVLGVAFGFAIFGGALPAVTIGAFAAAAPTSARRHGDAERHALAQEAWPRMIEEVRILTGSAGRSIPQALFEVGARAPAAMRPAFDAAHREWLVSTDFGRTIGVLKAGLGDATADATAETLLVAHDLGGTDLDRRLEALVDDRIQDIQGRKDARARQAGVRFARRFVLVVPLGMALAGMSVGAGRASYQTPGGQVAVAIGIAMVVACWVWAGRIMRLPDQERVFGG